MVSTFTDRGVSRGHRNGSPMSYSQFSSPLPLLFLPSSPRFYSWGWVDSVPGSLFLRKSYSAGNRAWDFWICSQKLRPLDHKCGEVPKYECISEIESENIGTHPWEEIFILQHGVVNNNSWATGSVSPSASSQMPDVSTCSAVRVKEMDINGSG
jgi:hypothetical protein